MISVQTPQPIPERNRHAPPQDRSRRYRCSGPGSVAGRLLDVPQRLRLRRFRLVLGLPASPGKSAGRDGDGTDKTDKADKGDHKDDSTDKGDDAEDAAITDSTWKNILDKGERKDVAGSYTVQDEGATLNLAGDLDTLTVQGANATIAADDIDTLVVQGANVTVYARDINHLQIQGADVTVHWLGDDPDIQDQGVGSTTGKLSQ